jgi:hypothetical protein
LSLPKAPLAQWRLHTALLILGSISVSRTNFRLSLQAARPGVEKGRHVPDPHKIKELLKDKAKMEQQAADARKWVQAGMKADAQKSTDSTQK